MDLNSEQIGTPPSSAWDALKNLTVQLNKAVTVSSETFRNQQWYVLNDSESGETFRVSDSLKIILDSRYRRMTPAAALALDQPHATENTKEQLALALVQLYRSHLIDLMPEDQLPKQIKQLREPQKPAKKPFSPLSIRIPLLDPDRLLTRLKPLAVLIFSPLSIAVILLLSLLGVGLGLANFDAISNDVLSQIDSPSSWWIFILAYLALKIIHETAHGLAVKHWGGSVHDVGVMLLVFFPVPYVDAAASSAFSDKYQRIGVAAAGIVAEVFCAALAVFVWLNVEPGLVRTFAFDIVFIGGISAVLFNGNPLMKFDAYYVLADYLEIPNLFTRSRKYVDYCIIRHVLRDSSATSNSYSNAEGRWLFGYGVLSSVYRLGVMVGIATYLVDTFFFVGVALAIWIVFAQMILPSFRFAVQLRRADTQSQRRVSLIARFATVVVALGIALAYVPLPQSTLAYGVVTVEDDAHIRAESDGFITNVSLTPGEFARKGDFIARLANPVLERDLAATKARVRAIKAEMDAARTNGVEVGIIAETLQGHEKQLAEIETRVANLQLASEYDGALVASTAKPILNRYIKRGETLGYIVNPTDLIIRVVVREEDLDLVQRDVRSVSFRVMSDLHTAHEGELLRVVPSALQELPSRGLGTDAGGNIAVDPSDEAGLRPIENVFQVDIRTKEPLLATNVATRAYARIEHAPEPLMPRALRAARRLFLSKFSI